MKTAPMLLNWRNKKYTYKSNFINFKPDTRNDVDMPICGADTESTLRGAIGNKKHDAALPDIYECQCISYATPKRKGIEWIPPGVCPLPILLNQFIKEMRTGGLDHKKTWFVYIHNLGYDIPQLFKWRPDLMTFARAGTYDQGKLPDNMKKNIRKKGQTKSEYFIDKIGNRSCFLRNRSLFIGTAPHFTVRCYWTRKDYADITFADTNTFFRGTLANIAKDLKLPVQKQERQVDIGRYDFRPSTADPIKKANFESYAIDDAEVTRLVGEQIVQLHREADFTKIRTSSPGFAFSYFRKQIGELGTIVYSGSLHEQDMALILDTYAGGRTGGRYHGPVGQEGEGLNIVDFASSYPCSMLGLPSFGPTMRYRRLKGAELDWPNVWRWLEECPSAFLRIDGEETDPHYPSLITENKGMLTPVYGKFERLATTGPEVYGGVKSGTLTVTKVHEAVICYDTIKVESPFAAFARAAYENKKKAEKGSIPYILAKLLLNSAYGKFIQATKAQLLGATAQDFVCFFPEGEEAGFAQLYLETYATAQLEDSDPIDALEELRNEIMFSAAAEGLQLESKLLGHMDTAKKEFAPSAIPPAASLITAISRARLRALIKCTGAIYWDTDSAFILDKSLAEIERCFALGSDWIHPRYVPLRMGEELGEIDLEVTKARGFLAGTKRYFLVGETANGKPKIKQAIHGITNLKKRDSGPVIRALATGKDFRYKTKAAPLKAKGTTDEKVGKFERRYVVPKFKLDDRMTWDYDESLKAWRGRMKTYEQLQYGPIPETPEKIYGGNIFASELQTARQRIGFIRIPKAKERYRGEYEGLSGTAKRQYFRKDGLPLDEWADEAGLSVRDVLDKLA